MSDEVFDPLEAEPIARKRLVLFYLIDTSGSMDGDKIGIVNEVMEEVLPELRNIGGADSDIQLAVLTFGTGCSWMYSTPQSLESARRISLRTAAPASYGSSKVSVPSDSRLQRMEKYRWEGSVSLTEEESMYACRVRRLEAKALSARACLDKRRR